MDIDIATPEGEVLELEPVDRLASIYVLRLYREAARTQRPLRTLLKERGPLAAALDAEESKIARRKPEALLDLVDTRLATLMSGTCPFSCPVAQNVFSFAEGFGLWVDEAKILLLAVIASGSGRLDDAVPGGTSGAGRDLTHLASVLTGLSVAATRAALAPDALLVRSGLIRRYERNYELSDRLELLDGTASAFLDTQTKVPLEQRWLANAPRPAYGLENVPHLAHEVATAIAVVKGALARRARGIQVLLHGEPGVGKTELARLIAAEAGADAYVLPDTRSDGAPLQADTRLRRYAFMQRLLAHQRRSLLILDEVEEMLATPDAGGFGRTPPSSNFKSWKNRLIEAAEVPGIWIANWIDAVDPALLRRFTLTLRVPTPPARLRIAMLARFGDGYAGDERIRTLVAERDDISPADLERARRAAELAADHAAFSAPECFLRALAMRASYAPIVPTARAQPCLPYRIEWLNTEPAVGELVSMLSQVGEGRLCFCGPPGTGKTALARHLAQALDRPLHAKKASDLISCWIGETEKNIAEAFADARRDGALLLLDEADSFLRARDGAQRSYEVTQVNQLLKELEGFDGVVALCTNFFETLDSAVLRRLDVKVRFARLEPLCAQHAFVDAATSLGIDRDDAKCVLAEQPLGGDRYALGDIAVSIRQARLRAKVPTASLLRDCLEAEVRTREEREGRPIGFRR